ncbi:O-phosphoseryl-tRNA(Sec) selenium transferase [Trachymyrmex zeteki]|uniref:O-phosphoseryl-tRNA(Sec) selenium transferase n=1 Tax=Mycetomoellerius zeteki TaxID=64791 RepID=A0A151WTE9_9HYME|nr:O-phosphoseryl-tRNA(Sec) selenium transferase [Trachymyrmex zeteki]
MNNQAFSLAERLIPSTYVNAKKSRENLIRHFIEHRKWPEEGWDDATIEAFLSDLSQMDSNNFPSNCSVGEREARIVSNIVARRHFRMGHGIGRSGDLEEVQPKAAGSSLMYKLTNSLVLEVIRYMGKESRRHIFSIENMKYEYLTLQTQNLIFLLTGVKSIAGCFLSPMATGMSLVLCMLTLKQDRPRAKYVLWPRIDQKSSFKSIITAGLEPIVIEMQIIGDELKTDMQRLEAQMAALGESVACVLTTTSCFAPRACDSVDTIAALCSQYNIPHLVNNAYGMLLVLVPGYRGTFRLKTILLNVLHYIAKSLQSTRCMHLIQEASRKGRVDAFVQSTDKNFLVPVGGAIIGSFDKNLLDRISKMYPGRASASSVMDVMITLLSLGMAGYKQLIAQRKEMYSYLKEELGKLATRHGERLLDTKGNPISMAMTLQCLSHQHDNKQVTMLGSMLFLRNVSGTRVITTTDSKHIVSHKFEGWGAHNSNYRVPYLTAAAALGMKRSDVDAFIQRLDKALTKVRRRSAPVTPTASLAGSSINGDAGGTGGPGESSTASTSRASSKDSLRK